MSSVIAHNNKIVITPNGKALTFDSLIAQANVVTGEDDKTLTDAVQTLCDGYGQGGATWSEILVLTEFTDMLSCARGLYNSISDIITYPAYLCYRGEREYRKFRWMVIGHAPSNGTDSSFAMIARDKNGTLTDKSLECMAVASTNEVHLNFGDSVEVTFDDIFENR